MQWTSKIARQIFEHIRYPQFSRSVTFPSNVYLSCGTKKLASWLIRYVKKNFFVWVIMFASIISLLWLLLFLFLLWSGWIFLWHSDIVMLGYGIYMLSLIHFVCRIYNVKIKCSDQYFSFHMVEMSKGIIHGQTSALWAIHSISVPLSSFLFSWNNLFWGTTFHEC